MPENVAPQEPQIRIIDRSPMTKGYVPVRLETSGGELQLRYGGYSVTSAG